MYDPVIGRFITPDNIIPNQYNPQSLNRYSYCLNNPLIYVDPSGHNIETLPPHTPETQFPENDWGAGSGGDFSVVDFLTSMNFNSGINNLLNPNMGIYLYEWANRLNAELKAFSNEFSEMTGGLSVWTVINEYNELTGESLDIFTVQKIFNDPEFAKKTMLTNENMHTIFRDMLNVNVPDNLYHAIQDGWLPMYSLKETGFHGYPFNIKFISPDGHREAVYSVTDWNLARNNAFRGTFNFFNPITNPGDHWHVDVVPYFQWLGN